MTAIMQGIRILEVAEHTFVPAASAVLSDWGAEVIKVEPTGRGDAMRALARTGVIDLGAGGVHVLLEHSNRGKQSIALDLTSEDGREIVYRLAEVSDVFLTNKLPRVRRDLAIDVDDIRARNPNIIYVRGSGYGPQGPDADQGGYDILGYWSRSGVGASAQPPDVDGFIGQPGPAYGDSIGAMTIAGGIAGPCSTASAPARLRSSTSHCSRPGCGRRRRAGAGLADGAAVEQCAPSSDRINNPLAASYRTQDGRWLFLSCLAGISLLARCVPRLRARRPRGRHPIQLARGSYRQRLRGGEPPAGAIGPAPRRTGGSGSPASGSVVVRPGLAGSRRGRSGQGERLRRRDPDRAGNDLPLVASPVQFDGRPQPTAACPGVQRARRRDPDGVTRLRLGDGRRAQGEGRRRIAAGWRRTGQPTLPTARFKTCVPAARRTPAPGSAAPAWIPCPSRFAAAPPSSKALPGT